MLEFLGAASLVTLGATIALLGPVITSWLTLNRERRQLLWNRELDRFFELEELAGALAERMGGYRPVEPDKTEIQAQILKLETAAGRFRRYPDVTNAIRALRNTTGWILANHGCFDTAEEEANIKRELIEHHKALLEACDQVLHRAS